MMMTMMIVVVIVALMIMSYILLQVATDHSFLFSSNSDIYNMMLILASALGSAPESRRIFAGAARSLANRFDNDDSSNDSKNIVRSNYLKPASSRLKENKISVVVIV